MINKWPVVIISNYRSGSSELALRLASDNFAVPLIEPIHRADIYEKLKDMYDSGNMKFVVKYHIDQIDQLELQKTLLEIDSFKIKITRKDTISQIVSYYISSIRNVWKQNIEEIESYYVPIDIDKIDNSIKTILTNDTLLSNSPIQFDYICYYEDLETDSKNHNFKTTQPINFNVIKSLVKSRLNYYITPKK